ncbi:MAG: DNA replication/repair protein RecF [Actinobacteria bacterium]|uniref:Unannotated protein n=1 Tax=freshwater metagenome TaxID=449393 RepID=A0A6J6CCF0_9ZZZZ|nr:DNA replication/repair protein RecF [Actinomycetota bacterium]
MWVSEIQLANFRNYASLNLTLKPGATLLHGPNGEGKTNLVEALVFLSQLSSHRHGSIKTLVQTGKTQAIASASANQGNRKVVVAAEINADESNRYFINANQQKRTADFLGNLPVVLFAPEDLDIVRRDPDDRRHFLDSTMALLRPRLAQLKIDYDRALKQRNALLKSAKFAKNPELSTLDIWDEQIASLGSKLTIARLELISELSPLLQDFYNKLSPAQEKISLQLVSLNSQEQEEEITQSDIEKQLREKMLQLRDQELERGITLVGPHRDELLIQKNDLIARSHASQGEAWSIALGLKLAVAKLLRDGSLGDPVVILDDVFSVLDPGRRSRILEFVLGFEQVLVTAADQSMAPEIEWSATYSISGGELSGD